MTSPRFTRRSLLSATAGWATAGAAAALAQPPAKTPVAPGSPESSGPAPGARNPLDGYEVRIVSAPDDPNQRGDLPAEFIWPSAALLAAPDKADGALKHESASKQGELGKWIDRLFVPGGEAAWRLLRESPSVVYLELPRAKSLARMRWNARNKMLWMPDRVEIVTDEGHPLETMAELAKTLAQQGFNEAPLSVAPAVEAQAKRVPWARGLTSVAWKLRGFALDRKWSTLSVQCSAEAPLELEVTLGRNGTLVALSGYGLQRLVVGPKQDLPFGKPPGG